VLAVDYVWVKWLGFVQRQAIVEHPFGTIKRQWGFDYTLLKTMPKVRGEFALIFTAYNLRRAISIFGVKYLMEKLKGSGFSVEQLFLPSFKLFTAFFFESDRQLNLSFLQIKRLKCA